MFHCVPELSHRAVDMPSSPIRKLVAFAQDAERRGIHVHYLNIGQPDVASPDAFWDAVRNLEIRTLEYAHSAGTEPLRVAAAQHYRSRGLDVEPQDVLVTTGGSEACLFAFLACFDPGDEVIVVEPFYANYTAFAKIAGVTLIPLLTKLEEDFEPPSAEEIASKITPRTKGILICNPSNPTGVAYSAKTILSLGKIAREHDLFLLLDEVYRDFYYGDEELISVLQLPDLEKNAVMLDSASKKFSLCGARIGFFVSKNRDLIAAALKFGQARLSSPTLDQIGVEACLLKTPPSYFAEMRAEYMARRDLLIRRLKRMPGVLCPKVEGAFYAIIRLPVADADAFCEWMVSKFEYNGQSVLLAPASGFYATPGLGRNEVRIAYVLEESRLDQAMDVLERALVAYSLNPVPNLSIHPQA
jgi:aspartate aminotransferase